MPSFAHLPLMSRTMHELRLKQDVRHMETFIFLDFKYLTCSKWSILLD